MSLRSEKTISRFTILADDGAKNACKDIQNIAKDYIGKILPLRRHPGGGVSNRIRCGLTRNIVKKMGEGCVIESGAEIHEGCVLGNKVGIGPNCMIDPQTIFEGYTMMGPDVHIYTENHLYNEGTHSFSGTEIKPVTIGEEVWIGYGAIILPGVNIGSHTIIGAGSVVTKDVPSGILAAGNPCVVKKVIDAFYYGMGTEKKR